MSMSSVSVRRCSDAELFTLSRAGDRRAREQLIERYLPLARSVARRFFSGTSEREDVLQAASLALVKAVDRYDPSYGSAFSSFAVPTISGELKRFFRDTGWGLRVPRALKERSLEIEAAIDEIEPALGRSPTPAELAEYTGLSREHLIEALGVAQTRAIRPLEVSTGDGEDETYDRGLGADDPHYELVEELVTIAPAFGALPPREREILRLRFGGELAQSEIAGRFGISQMQVSRLIRRALDTMAQELNSDEAQAA
jgi:RNA polymerase sigma-B factor